MYEPYSRLFIFKQLQILESNSSKNTCCNNSCFPLAFFQNSLCHTQKIVLVYDARCLSVLEENQMSFFVYFVWKLLFQARINRKISNNMSHSLLTAYKHILINKMKLRANLWAFHENWKSLNEWIERYELWINDPKNFFQEFI